MPLPEFEEFNIQFVQEISNHPCIFNVQIRDNISKEDQEKVWLSIADKFSARVQDCRIRWRYLRGGLTRYLRKAKRSSIQGKNAPKQFYLYEHMQFVIPFLKFRKPFGIPKEQSDDDCCEFDLTHDSSDEEKVKPILPNFSDFGKNMEHVERNSEGSIEQNSNLQLFRSPYEDEQVKSKITSSISIECTPDCRKRKAWALDKTSDTAVEENSNMQFFKSLLPDLAELDQYQTRKFKRKVLEILDEIISEKRSN